MNIVSRSSQNGASQALALLDPLMPLLAPEGASALIGAVQKIDSELVQQDSEIKSSYNEAEAAFQRESAINIRLKAEIESSVQKRKQADADLRDLQNQKATLTNRVDQLRKELNALKDIASKDKADKELAQQLAEKSVNGLIMGNAGNAYNAVWWYRMMRGLANDPPDMSINPVTDTALIPAIQGIMNRWLTTIPTT